MFFMTKMTCGCVSDLEVQVIHDEILTLTDRSWASSSQGRIVSSQFLCTFRATDHKAFIYKYQYMLLIRSFFSLLEKYIHRIFQYIQTQRVRVSGHIIIIYAILLTLDVLFIRSGFTRVVILKSQYASPHFDILPYLIIRSNKYFFHAPEKFLSDIIPTGCLTQTLAV